MILLFAFCYKRYESCSSCFRLYLFCHEISCCLFRTIKKMMNSTSRYLDDVTTPYFAKMACQIHVYPTELQLNKANPFDTGPFLDLNLDLPIKNVIVSSRTTIHWLILIWKQLISHFVIVMLLYPPPPPPVPMVHIFHGLFVL